jgi:hypothetical protein
MFRTAVLRKMLACQYMKLPRVTSGQLKSSSFLTSKADDSNKQHVRAGPVTVRFDMYNIAYRLLYSTVVAHGAKLYSHNPGAP